MTKTQTFCDFCEKEFVSKYWDDAPCKITLSLGGPAQAFESRAAEHVCNACRHALVERWDSLILSKKIVDKK
jgi:hypothetical protein